MFKKHFFIHSLRHYYPTRAAKKHSGGEKREGEFFLNSDIKYERIKTYTQKLNHRKADPIDFEVRWRRQSPA